MDFLWSLHVGHFMWSLHVNTWSDHMKWPHEVTTCSVGHCMRSLHVGHMHCTCIFHVVTSCEHMKWPTWSDHMQWPHEVTTCSDPHEVTTWSDHMQCGSLPMVTACGSHALHMHLSLDVFDASKLLYDEVCPYSCVARVLAVDQIDSSVIWSIITSVLKL